MCPLCPILCVREQFEIDSSMRLAFRYAMIIVSQLVIQQPNMQNFTNNTDGSVSISKSSLWLLSLQRESDNNLWYKKLMQEQLGLTSKGVDDVLTRIRR